MGGGQSLLGRRLIRVVGREQAATRRGRLASWGSPEPCSFGDPPSSPSPSAVSPTTGNRFDSALGSYGVCYFGTDLLACYGETLARFRPDLGLAAIASEEGFMGIGEVPADWRFRRLAAQVRFIETPERPRLQFLDIEGSPDAGSATRRTGRPAQLLWATPILMYRLFEAPTVESPDSLANGLTSNLPTMARRNTLGFVTSHAFRRTGSAGQRSKALE